MHDYAVGNHLEAAGYLGWPYEDEEPSSCPRLSPAQLRALMDDEDEEGKARLKRQKTQERQERQERQRGK